MRSSRAMTDSRFSYNVAVNANLCGHSTAWLWYWNGKLCDIITVLWPGPKGHPQLRNHCIKKNKLQSQGESIQDCSKNSNVIWGWDLGSEERAKAKLDVVEMKMLRWMFGVTKLDRIRNKITKRTTSGRNSKKSAGKWYKHIMKRE